MVLWWLWLQGGKRRLELGDKMKTEQAKPAGSSIAFS